MSAFTPQQSAAITAHGNVLVVAGAGTGKTSTLVERCVTRLLNPVEPLSLDEILMVTFTEAAALEMKERIRRRLEKELIRCSDETGPAALALKEHIESQLALLDSAPISTLHGFCLQLIRRHFHDLEIDPGVLVLDEDQSRLLREEAMDAYLNACHEGTEPEANDVMFRSLKSGQPERVPDGVYRTIADSLSPPYTLPYSLELCRRHLDDLVLVSDDALREAVALMFRGAKLAVEPAAASAAAALIGPLRERLGGKMVGLIVCGTNIAPERYVEHLTRGMALLEHRLSG